MSPGQRLAGLLQPPAWWPDVVVSVGLLALVATDLAVRAQPGTVPANALAYALAAGTTLPFSLHRRHPVSVTAVTAGCLVAYSAGHFSAYPGYGAFALVAGLALHAPRRTAVAGSLACVAALAVSLALQPAGVVDASSWVTTGLTAAVAWLAGRNVRVRRERWAALESRARAVEHERDARARGAVVEERLRIARELHDVVAHSMSVVTVQAGVAHHLAGTRPEVVADALATIEETSREALVELRRILGVLRAQDEAGDLHPARGLADLPALARRLGDAGLLVRVDVDGAPTTLPPAVDLTAFRVIQESLTNVLRHGGPTARVQVRYHADRVRVQVADPGRDPSPGTGPPRDAADAGTGAVDGPGHGLVGMRERVALFDGSLRAGSTPSGGFEVDATLPLSAGGPVPVRAVPQ